MKLFVTQTGVGYFRELATGKIVSKVDLPPGEHAIQDGFEFVQVQSKADLDAVQVAQPELSEDDRVKQLIDEQLKTMALAELKKAGKVRADYAIS